MVEEYNVPRTMRQRKDSLDVRQMGSLGVHPVLLKYVDVLLPVEDAAIDVTVLSLHVHAIHTSKTQAIGIQR